MREYLKLSIAMLKTIICIFLQKLIKESAHNTTHNIF